jgi:ribokinase
MTMPSLKLKPGSIIVLGSSNTDLVIRGPRLPGSGETVLDGEFFEAAGGKGANQAVAAARASATEVVFIAAVGDDAYGRRALDGFAAEQLDCRFVKVVAGARSGVALIMVEQSGENLISVASGANLALTPSDVDAVDDAVFARAVVFLASLESPLETVIRGLQRAREVDHTTILNPAPAMAEIIERDVLAWVDVVTPNRVEAAMLSGIEIRDPSDAQRVGRYFAQQGCRRTVITLGADGCMVIEDGRAQQIPAMRVVPLDATGAGDAFNGALAAALAEGQSLFEAATWANRAAALSVTRSGAQPSLPRREELEPTPE